MESQQESYREVLAAFPGKRVVVRLLDAGADKPLAFLSLGEEENPALGRRGLRALRASESVLRDQLTALARAQADTDAELWVMAPMVATVEETAFITRAIHDAGIRTAGVMVEIPSVALIADRVLARTDFASIGTNDLTQYTMAADRQLGSVAALQDPWHPAVLQLVKSVGAAGASSGKPVGVCGEAAADPFSPWCWPGSVSRACRCRPRRSQMSAYPSRGTASTTQPRSPRQPWRPTRPPMPERRPARPPTPSPPGASPASEPGGTTMTTTSQATTSRGGEPASPSRDSAPSFPA
ncbi:hypothetical protein GCM10025869_17120 [Homoserinibacter gongjuensis]|uniref:PEP-utilising enzyme C-terminal domain-containing protein n=1 Tax=Homoserinibacter gongjuensis TaxID=1162968 RepID=A0ABQ6JS93_9MICO|nr:hypothetical protein GCM10025869_17120 [Homoserinibacter gongjuensis]